MVLFITHSARAVKSVLQRPVARAVRSNSLVRVARAAAPPHASQHGRASIHHCLSMLPAGQRGAFSTTAAAGAAAVVTQPIVLVKIGVDGNDRSLPLTYDALIRMDAAALLEELVKSVRFSADLKDVPLGKCTVWLLPRVAGDEATLAEEDAAVELRAAATIGDLLTAQKWTPTRLLFLRVRTPRELGGEYDADLTRFYQAALSAEPQPASDGSGVILWRLRDPADPSKHLDWPQLQQKVLLERDFYARFFNKSKWLGGLPTDGPQRKYVVMGQPGIGKSAFGWWLVAQLLRAKRTVVYSRNSAKRGTPPEMTHYVFHRGVALDVETLWSVRQVLALPSTIHICDSCKPRLHDKCHKIMITSPDPDMWRWFVEKETAVRVHFPLYSDAELEALRVAEFGDALSRDVLALRVRAWGRVPRQVFSLRQSEVKAMIVRALQLASFDTLQRAMVETSVSMARPTDDSPHSLFLLDADRATFAAGDVTVRSSAVLKRMARHVASEQSSQVFHAIQQLLKSGSTRSLAGTLFEEMALERLARGGTFKVRPLHRLDTGAGSGVAQTGTDSTVVQPGTVVQIAVGGDRAPRVADTPADASMNATVASTTLTLAKAVSSETFQSLRSIAQGCESDQWSLETHRFIPAAKNFAAIDAIEVGLRLIQLTVTHGRHTVKVTSGRSKSEGLAAIARTLLPKLKSKDRWNNTTTPYLEFYFVMPQGAAANAFEAQELTFDDATMQPEKIAVPGKRYNQGFKASKKVVEVRQYALEMPLEELRGADADETPPRDDIDDAGIDDAGESTGET